MYACARMSCAEFISFERNLTTQNQFNQICMHLMCKEGGNGNFITLKSSINDTYTVDIYGGMGH